MMTLEDARAYWFRSWNAAMSFADSHLEGDERRSLENHCDAMYIAFNSIAKQIARRPVSCDHCPSCRKPVSLYKCELSPAYESDMLFEYCPHCGQHIDWGDRK